MSIFFFLCFGPAGLGPPRLGLHFNQRLHFVNMFLYLITMNSLEMKHSMMSFDKHYVGLLHNYING